MTTKTEAESLGEQIKRHIVYYGNAREERVALNNRGEHFKIIERDLARLVALATSEPRLTPVGAGDGNTYVVSEQPRSRALHPTWYSPDLNMPVRSEPPAPQAVGERLPLTDERIQELEAMYTPPSQYEQDPCYLDAEGFARAVEAEVTKLCNHATATAQIAALRAELEKAREDARRLAFVYSGQRTESNALVELELKILNGEYPSLAEARAAIDAAMSTDQAERGRYETPR